MMKMHHIRKLNALCPQTCKQAICFEWIFRRFPYQIGRKYTPRSRLERSSSTQKIPSPKPQHQPHCVVLSPVQKHHVITGVDP